MGAVASIPASRAAQILPGSSSRSPSPTARPASPSPTTTAATPPPPPRIDSGLWTGNRMLFGPHFILRYPLTRPPTAALPPNSFVAPGASDLGTALMVTDQIAATAASVATLGGAGITPEMIAGWRAGRNEVNAHPGEMHVVTQALRCVVNVRRLSLSMPLLDVSLHEEDRNKKCGLKFVVDSEVPCVVNVYLLAQEQEGKVLHHMVPTFCSSPIATIPLPAGMGQAVDVSAHFPAGILVHDVLAHYSALMSLYFPASSSSPSPSPPASPRSASPISESAAGAAPVAGSASSRSSTPLLAPTGRPGSPFPTPATNTAPIYPLVITVCGDSTLLAATDLGSTCTEQWTMVAIDPRDWEPRVIKQKLWMPGNPCTSLLLQEIYGFTTGAGDATASAASGAPDPSQQPECIVCMADAKDTMVLPCRHLCLCKECGSQLRRQSSKCPICRQDFHSLLHVATGKDGVAGTDDEDHGGSGKGGDVGKGGGALSAAGPSVMRTAHM
ncbi:hypothetical protein BCR44DRAFT_30483 [Catenaria anguillulae PL171]|uniref:RING-type domain-containing protein n=1 Tax=Catenaria anguillulae PL171 TaxID=765915 RepID=A0A1Y2HKM1_9FUNG|nr:hypothetical protein BCR44DRAFT_30483 [Catenaria anguillulae PL171]